MVILFLKPPMGDSCGFRVALLKDADQLKKVSDIVFTLMSVLAPMFSCISCKYMQYMYMHACTSSKLLINNLYLYWFCCHLQIASGSRRSYGIAVVDRFPFSSRCPVKQSSNLRAAVCQTKQQNMLFEQQILCYILDLCHSGVFSWFIFSIKVI